MKRLLVKLGFMCEFEETQVGVQGFLLFAGFVVLIFLWAGASLPWAK